MALPCIGRATITKPSHLFFLGTRTTWLEQSIHRGSSGGWSSWPTLISYQRITIDWSRIPSCIGISPQRLIDEAPWVLAERIDTLILTLAQRWKLVQQLVDESPKILPERIGNFSLNPDERWIVAQQLVVGAPVQLIRYIGNFDLTLAQRWALAQELVPQAPEALAEYIGPWDLSSEQCGALAPQLIGRASSVLASYIGEWNLTPAQRWTLILQLGVRNPEIIAPSIIDKFSLTAVQVGTLLQQRVARDALAYHLPPRRDNRRDVEQYLPEALAARDRLVDVAPPAMLADVVLLSRALPKDGSPVLIDTLRRQAVRVENIGGGRLREIIHNYAGPDNVQAVRDELARAEAGNATSRYLDAVTELLRLARAVYEHPAAISADAIAIVPALAQLSDAPRSLSVIGQSAVELRARFVTADAPARRVIVQTLLALDQHAFAAAAPAESAHGGSATACGTMAALVRLLYGQGYGTAVWLQVAESLDALAADWDATPSAVRREALHMLGARAHALVDEVLVRYQVNFFVALRAMNDPERTAGFCSTLYRGTSVMQLGRWLERLGIRPGARRVTRQALALMETPPADVAWQPWLLDDAHFPADRRVVGGKAAGLHALSQAYPTLTPPGIVLPARPLASRLGPSERTEIREAVRALEARVGKQLGSGLQLAVRSGAAVSMPGTMATILHVSDAATLWRAIDQVYASWNNPAAVAYRTANGIPHDWGTAVTIMPMVDAAHDAASGAGVISSIFGITFGQQVFGEALVSGAHHGNDVLAADVSAQLRAIVASLETAQQQPVELEYAVESGQLRLLQLRQAHLAPVQWREWYRHAAQHGILSEDAANKAMAELDLVRQTTVVDPRQPRPSPLVQGLSGEGHAVTGTVAHTASDIAAIQDSGGVAILWTPSPDARDTVALALQCGGLVVCGGNALAHLFDVARDMRLPFLWGASAMEPLAPMAALTIDPASGSAYPGHLPLQGSVVFSLPVGSLDG